MRIALFATCVADTMFPEAARATAKKRMIRLRLARESAKLNKAEEQALANEGLSQ